MMNIISYLKKIWHDQKYMVLGLTIFSAVFEFAFGWLLFEAKFNEIFETVATMLPSSLMNFIGVTTGGNFYGSQLLSFGFSHPLILISLSLLPINIPARYISGEIESKTMDLFLTKPIKRNVIPTSLFIFLAVVMLLQTIALYFGTYLGYRLFSLDIDIHLYFKISVTIYLFFLSMGMVSMMIAISQNERGKAIAKSVSLFIVLFFFDTIIRLNKSLENLTSYSDFNLYQPGKLIRGEGDFWGTVMVLLILIIVFWVLSIILFKKRDL